VFLSTLAEKMTLKLNSWEIQHGYFFYSFWLDRKIYERKKKIDFHVLSPEASGD